MDIRKIHEGVKRDEEGVPVTILDPMDQPYPAPDGTECTITVLGSESKRVRNASIEIARRRTRPGRRYQFTPEDAMEFRIELAAAAVVDWHGWEANGEPWPCEPENVRELLGVRHILVQVETAIQNHAFFTAKG